jgi:hypothetical protein
MAPDASHPAGRAPGVRPAGFPVAAAILLLLIAVAVAPVLDDIAAFIADAPYIRLLPLAIERSQDSTAHEALSAAWNAFSQFLAGIPVL